MLSAGIQYSMHDLICDGK